MVIKDGYHMMITFGNDFQKPVEITSKSKNRNKYIFFKIVVWYNVDYNTFVINKNSKFIFKDVTFTKNDRLKYGSTIPKEVASLGVDTFRSLNSIDLIILPKNVTQIHERCFEGCSTLTSLQITTNLMKIEPGAFSMCRTLRRVFLPFQTRYHSTAQSDIINVNINNYNQPKSYLGGCCFNCCESLVEVELPDFYEFYVVIASQNARVFKLLKYRRVSHISMIIVLINAFHLV
ncbi:hypothetical protein EIN_451250 [Entamoeba invadens IP1]|uniref:Leucine rich repeat containing protein BspA family protein n=1 Tax=Entamoeba invadens IP1 TaxID=370355 RepID=A0A0A1U9C7_ENTIV|nr:hypothetical protein EIN_451250 [Entamoeba invadens IP1]ELP91524.1 hypothetical protein EIN_451250 [Entamoeba invadens IP1]|eukprot:XP_004258295.1 hypothetical protein EIN_451250 [Entamoeba invadens IP1]